MVLRPQGLIPERRRSWSSPSGIAAEVAEIARSRCAWSARAGGTAPAAPVADAIMRAEHIIKQFGGLVAVDDVSLDDPARLDRVDDRAERRRQDDVLQHAHRACTSRRRDGSCSASATSPAPRPDVITALRRRAHLPEHPPVRRDDRAGERDGRASRADAGGPVRLDRAPAAGPPRGARGRASAPASCSTTSACDRGRRPARQRSCPTATSAGWRSPARWPPSRSCCCSTSRPPA